MKEGEEVGWEEEEDERGGSYCEGCKGELAWCVFRATERRGREIYDEEGDESVLKGEEEVFTVSGEGKLVAEGVR